jgi:hypothetical protein
MPAHLMRRLLAVALTAVAVVTALAGPATASNTPPTAHTGLLGTWVNTNPNTGNVKQIVVRRDGTGGITVDAFGACTPTLCEWGAVPAIVYGSSVSSTTGTMFQTNQRFVSNGAEWSRKELFGELLSTSAGPRLRVRQLTAFSDGSGRRNYTVTETFALGHGQSPTIAGNAVSGYRVGAPPAPIAGLFGTWKNVSASPAVVSLKISNSAGTPLVQAFGACSPSPCDMGTSRGITFGSSVSATSGRTVLAPYSFGFKNQQLLITHWVGSDGRERLTVENYNEFTDGSGRSNYMRAETFVRA